MTDTVVGIADRSRERFRPMFSTEFLRTLADERERQVIDQLRVRSLIRPHRAPQRDSAVAAPKPRDRR
jgi:hypothetical protein